MSIFATSGMRSRPSSARWYFCICRYCEVRPGFRTGYNAALVHSVFLLVLCPDCNFAYSHMPFPECRFFSTTLARQAALRPVAPYPLHPSSDGSCCICSVKVKGNITPLRTEPVDTEDYMRMQLSRTSESRLVLN